MGKYNEGFGQPLKGFPGKRVESWALWQVLDNYTMLSDVGQYGWGLLGVSCCLHCSPLRWNW